MNDLVSVIITTHQRKPEILKRAIDSIYNQTYQSFEIFVVDDAPGYECHQEIVELTQGYDERMHYIINTRKAGACASRNEGLALSKGKYVALLDDDDEWCSDKLETMLPAFSDDIALVYSKFRIFDENKNPLKRVEPKVYEGDIFKELLLYGNFVGGCSVPVMLKDAVVEVGLFDEALPAAQDYDLWMRIAKKYKIKFLDYVGVNYYMTKVAISASPKRQVVSQKMVLEKYYDDFSQLPAAKERTVSTILYYLFADGKYKEAHSLYLKHNDVVKYSKYLKLKLKGTAKFFLLKTKIHNR